MERKALKLALEALEGIQRYGLDTLSGRVDGPDDREWQRAGVNEMTKQARLGITAIKEALAQPAQEPVACVMGTYGGMFVVGPLNSAVVLPVGMALYATPQHTATWVGLTAEETSGFTQHEMTVVKYVSKVLQEKNT